MRILVICLALMLLVGLSANMQAAGNQPVRAVAARVSQAPVIDGRLNDAAWKKAPELAGFVLLSTHKKPAAPTSVKVVTDGKALYVGFRCAEPNMDKLAPTRLERDSQVWLDDSVEVVIDPMNDRRGFAHLIVNAAGAVYDATGSITADSVSEEAAWNGDWQASASRGKAEWYAEVKVPFSTLGMTPEESPCLGVNFARARITGTPEYSTWSPSADQFVNPQHYGELVLPWSDNSYITVDLALPEVLYVGKQTQGFTIINRSRQKLDLRFEYEITGTAHMTGNTEYATVHPGMKGIGSFTLDMGGPGRFQLTARVQDRKGRVLYSAGRSVVVPGPIVLEEAMYALNHKRAQASISINVSPEQAAASDLRVILFSSRSADPVETKIVKAPLSSPVVVSFDLAHQPEGNYAMRADLMRDNKVLAFVRSKPMPFHPGAPVGFDTNGFLTVDGKPYFPVGMYTLQDGKGSDHDLILREASEAGFNTTVFYALTNETVLPLMDAANRNGIKAFVYPTSPFSVAGVETTLANAPKDIAAKKNHPALLGWYIVDEPEGIGKGAVDKTRELYQIVKEADPSHPCSLVVMSPGAVAKYKSCTDIMWIDPYPIPHAPVTFVTDCVEGAVKNVEKDKPVWAIPQAFDWAVWHNGKVNGVHRPTNEEERCMTYLALVHGAKGIIYWAHTASRYYIRDYPDHWAYMKKLAGELHDLSPVLLTPDVARVVGLEPKDAPIDTMVKRLNGQTYVFAVNHENKAVKAKLSLPESKASAPADVLFEQRTVPVSDGSWQDDFKPLEVHVYRVEE